MIHHCTSCSFSFIFSDGAASLPEEETKVVKAQALDDGMDGGYWTQTTTTRKRPERSKQDCGAGNKSHSSKKSHKKRAKKSRSAATEPRDTASNRTATSAPPDLNNIVQQGLAGLATPTGQSQQVNGQRQTQNQGAPIIFNIYLGLPPPQVP